jgi:hypothetical protein
MHVRKALLHIVPGYGARQNALLDYAWITIFKNRLTRQALMSVRCRMLI